MAVLRFRFDSLDFHEELSRKTIKNGCPQQVSTTGVNMGIRTHNTKVYKRIVIGFYLTRHQKRDLSQLLEFLGN